MGISNERSRSGGTGIAIPFNVTRRAYIIEEMADFGGWAHLRTVVRIESETRTREGGVPGRAHHLTERTV